MRSPLTGIVFALELTHDINMVLPLLVAVTIAHGFTVLTGPGPLGHPTSNCLLNRAIISDM